MERFAVVVVISDRELIGVGPGIVDVLIDVVIVGKK